MSSSRFSIPLQDLNPNTFFMATHKRRKQSRKQQSIVVSQLFLITQEVSTLFPGLTPMTKNISLRQPASEPRYTGT